MSDNPSPLLPSLKDVQHLFETWRATRQYRCPIPDQLWQAAASLATSYPLSTISKELRLNYSDLKKRIESFSGCEPIGIQDEISFVELPLGLSETASTRQRPPYPCKLVMKKPSGERMSCTFYESVPADLVYLVEAFVTPKP